jgi:phosphoheptose isomerase
MITAKQIVDQTNEIARIIYESRGYSTPEGTEFHTETINRHPHERQCWSAACLIQELMTQTDVMNALDELEDDEGQ